MEYLLVNAQPIFAEGVRFSLASIARGKILAGANCAAQVQAEIRGLKELKLVIIDLDIDDNAALNIIRDIHRLELNIPIYVFYSELSIALLRFTQMHGVRGYIHKTACREELVETVRGGLQGGSCLPEEVTKYIESVKYGASDALKITQRQLEVLAMMAEGLENKRIARSLGISEHTIKIHVRSLLHTFGVSNRTACVLEAQHRGILALEKTLFHGNIYV